MRLNNETMVLEVSEHAAEITSFRNHQTGIEYMWQGDPTFWAGRNPILFPIVGNTYSKTYSIHGKTYAMGNHGIARHATFTCVKQTEDQIVMQLRDDEATRQVYPFPFLLEVTYTLHDTQVEIDYRVVNTGTEEMPFSFGLHPAFNCPLQADESFTDYHLELACPEALIRYDHQREEFIQEDTVTQTFALDYDVLFRTIMLEHVKSPYVRLTNGKHGVEVSCAGYRWLAFWTKPNAPYVCIEPWHGLSDLKENDTPFEKRPGTLLLAPGHSFTTGYSIRVF